MITGTGKMKVPIAAYFSLLYWLLASCSTNSEHIYVQEGNAGGLIEIGEKWIRKENSIYGVGPQTFIVSKDLVQSDRFVIEAKISLDTMNVTNASFLLWGNHFNFDGIVKKHKDPAILLSGSLVESPALIGKTSAFIKSRTPFLFTVKGDHQEIGFYIDGRKMYSCPNRLDTAGNIGFKAGNAGLHIYDFKVTGCLTKQKELTHLFKSGDGGYHTYRIPALTVTNKGSILAFAEGRKNNSSDSGDIDVILKRSDDNGQTWSDSRTIWDDGSNTCGNPAPVVDRETGTIFVLLTGNLGTDWEHQIINQTSKDTRRIFVTQSTDDGLSWTKPAEITQNVKMNHWTWYATGPCQGIQIANGPYKGRLVIPCDHVESVTNKYYSHIIYSDDHGVNWKLGGRTPEDGVNECTVVEISGGRLLLNMRNYDPVSKNRKVAVSEDGGITWSILKSDQTLIEPVCQASMHRYSPEANDAGKLLFMNPASQEERHNMTLRLSNDDGGSWTKSISLYRGPSAYSDIFRLSNGNIGCLYEAGYIHSYEGIVFEQVKIADLEKTRIK